MAAGFEKIRNEHSILVWDVRGNNTSPTTRLDFNTESVIYSTNYSALSQSSTEAQTTSATSSISKALNNLPTTLSSLTMGINIGSTHSMLTSSTNNFNDPKLSQSKPDLIKPVYETGTSETCNSLAWNPNNQNQLLAGVNGKSLKIFDIRCEFLNSLA